MTDKPPPDFTIRSNDGNYELMADQYEVEAEQRRENEMEAERRREYRERANKGVGR